MAEFPDCILRNVKIDVVKKSFQFTAVAEFAELADVVDDVDALRHLAMLEDGVVVTVQPFVKQLSLYPTKTGAQRRERPPMPILPEYDPSDWQSRPRMADPVQPPDDRPTGESVDDFLGDTGA